MWQEWPHQKILPQKDQRHSYLLKEEESFMTIRLDKKKSSLTDMIVGKFNYCVINYER